MNKTKVALPSNGEDLSTPLASSFVRCSYFVIVDLERQKIIKTFLNSVQCAARGVGIQVAQSLIDQQVEMIISPEVDSSAYIFLKKADIKIYLGIKGTLKENIELFCQKKLVELKMTTEYRTADNLYVICDSF